MVRRRQDAMISARAPIELVRAIEVYADERDAPFSEAVRLLLVHGLEAQGLELPDEAVQPPRRVPADTPAVDEWAHRHEADTGQRLGRHTRRVELGVWTSGDVRGATPPVNRGTWAPKKLGHPVHRYGRLDVRAPRTGSPAIADEGACGSTCPGVATWVTYQPSPSCSTDEELLGHRRRAGPQGCLGDAAWGCPLRRRIRRWPRRTSSLTRARPGLTEPLPGRAQRRRRPRRRGTQSFYRVNPPPGDGGGVWT